MFSLVLLLNELLKSGLSSLANDKLALNVFKCSSTWLLKGDLLSLVYKSLVNVLVGVEEEAGVSFLMTVLDGVTTFSEFFDTIVCRQSSGCLVVIRREPLVRLRVRILPFDDAPPL